MKIKWNKSEKIWDVIQWPHDFVIESFHDFSEAWNYIKKIRANVKNC